MIDIDLWVVGVDMMVDVIWVVLICVVGIVVLLMLLMNYWMIVELVEYLLK